MFTIIVFCMLCVMMKIKLTTITLVSTKILTESYFRRIFTCSVMLTHIYSTVRQRSTSLCQHSCLSSACSGYEYSWFELHWVFQCHQFIMLENAVKYHFLSKYVNYNYVRMYVTSVVSYEDRRSKRLQHELCATVPYCHPRYIKAGMLQSGSVHLKIRQVN